MYNIFLLLVGFILGFLNSVALKWTIKKMLSKKNPLISVGSLMLRLTIISIVFFIFLDGKWQNALYILLGFSSAKFIFVFIEKNRRIKK